MTDDVQSDTGEYQTVYVSEAPKRLFGNVLIDGADGQCIYIHAGIEERCPNEAVAHTYIEHGGESIRVEMCAEHAPEDVPEPPSTEQQELVPDGGTEETEGRRWLHVCACGEELMLTGPEYRNPGIIEHWRNDCPVAPRGYQT